MDTLTSRAPGLPDTAQFTLLHHGRPMRFRGSATTWQGVSGHGAQIDQCRYTCDQCGAKLDVTLTEPC